MPNFLPSREPWPSWPLQVLLVGLCSAAGANLRSLDALPFLRSPLLSPPHPGVARMRPGRAGGGVGADTSTGLHVLSGQDSQVSTLPSHLHGSVLPLQSDRRLIPLPLGSLLLQLSMDPLKPLQRPACLAHSSCQKPPLVPILSPLGRK